MSLPTATTGVLMVGIDDSPIAAWFVGRLEGLNSLHDLPGKQRRFSPARP